MEELARRIEEHLARQTGGEVAIHEVRPLPGGACQENYRVDVTFAAGPRAGAARGGAGPLAGERRLVLRSDARQSLPGSLDRAAEYEVICAAVAAGVRTPAARWPARGLVRPEAHAYFLDWVDGVAIGRRVVSHPSLAAARERLPEQLAETLAAIHRITPGSAPELPLPDRDVDPVDSALATVRAMLDRLPEPHPALELAYRWLDEHRPPLAKRTLVHGDFRTGNFMVTPEGLSAVLDWEFAHWGDPFDDLGWLCVRDWRFGVLDKPAGGLETRRRFYEAYEKAADRAVDPAAVHFWEVMGNVRWGAGAVMQGERYLAGGVRDLELLAIPRRACEMEYEALRLIEVGPSAL